MNAFAEAAEEYRKARGRGARIANVSPAKTTFKGIETSEAFLSDMAAPEYLVDGVMLQGCLYSLCGFTGHGKTALSVLLSIAVARGADFDGRETQQGSVLFLAGENPDNVRMQYKAALLAQSMADSAHVFWHSGNFAIKEHFDALAEQAEAIPDLKLIVADTLQAFFPGDNDNDNMQMLEAARQFRPFCDLEGSPTVIVPCHPSGKHPDKANLVPRGGGAFMNEVDGNFTVWTDAAKATTFHSQGKHRGAFFEALSFKMEEREFSEICDAKHRPIPMTVCRELLIGEQIDTEKAEETMEVSALAAIQGNASITVRALGADIGVGKTKAGNIIDGLIGQKLVKRRARKLFLTTEGEEVLADAEQ